MWTWIRVGTGFLVVISGGWAVVDSFTVGWAAVPAVVACLALAVWDRPRLNVVTLAAAAVVSTVVSVGYDGTASNRAALWWFVETVLLLAILHLTARRATTIAEYVVIAAGAGALFATPFRLGPLMDPPAPEDELILLGLLWLSMAGMAIVVGRFLYRMRRRSEVAVATARRSQRLALARDLHDFVAHDVNGMVVQAQAAQFVAASDPQQALAALARIEAAGLRALSSLDRTVVLLQEHHDRLRDAAADFADIETLVRRFTESSGARIGLDIDPDLRSLRPAEEVTAAAHRVVVESLSNIRRHAPDAADVTIRLRHRKPDLHVEVVNDLPDAEIHTRPAGGRGLLGLTEHLASLGGTIDAGPDARGWNVTAVIPL